LFAFPSLRLENEDACVEDVTDGVDDNGREMEEIEPADRTF
jgi:hypothetical protein